MLWRSNQCGAVNKRVGINSITTEDPGVNAQYLALVSTVDVYQDPVWQLILHLNIGRQSHTRSE